MLNFCKHSSYRTFRRYLRTLYGADQTSTIRHTNSKILQRLLVVEYYCQIVVASNMSNPIFNASLQELRDIHTDLTEEDIATLATARLAEEQPRDRMWYRINAVKVLGGKSKLQPTVNARLSTVSWRETFWCYCHSAQK